jgi:hypothetical protein
MANALMVRWASGSLSAGRKWRAAPPCGQAKPVVRTALRVGGKNDSAEALLRWHRERVARMWPSSKDEGRVDRALGKIWLRGWYAW